MAWTVPSHKDVKFAVGLQTAIGATPSTYYALPCPEEVDVDVDQGYDFFQMGGGGYRGETHYETKGAITTGKFTLPAYPGYTGVGDLYDWIWGRDTAANYYQGYWATLVKYVRRGSSAWVETYPDCKVESGNVKLDYGAHFVALELNVKGITLPTTGTSYVTEDTTLLGMTPYRFNQASIQLDLGSGLAAELLTRNHSLDFDNMLSQADGENLDGYTTPSNLPNSEWTKWTVGFDRQFSDTALRAAFLAGTECAYVLTLTSGGTVCTFTMGRGIYEKAPLTLPNSGMIKQAASMKALTPIATGNDDPEDMWPCVISESPAGT